MLIQKLSAGVRHLRTWSANELDKVTTWLQRMNARGHDILVRPTGEHGLVLVDNLKTNDIERLQAGAFAPAAVIAVAPDVYQGWIKLSDQAVSPRVREVAAEILTQQCEGATRQAETNPYGRLAGFINHAPEHEQQGHAPHVLARDCTGKSALNGPALVARIEHALDQKDVAQEKQRRLNAIRAFQPEHVQRDPIYEYRRQAKQLLHRHGESLDPARLDQQIAMQMLQMKSYSQNGIVQALQIGSTNFESMQGNQVNERANGTVQRSVAMLKADTLQQFEQQREQGRSLESGRNLGR